MAYENNNIEKPYLMLLNITVPQPEHAKILSKLNELSNGTVKPVYFDKHGGAFLFTTKLNARQLYDRLIGVLLNDDRYIIIELGKDGIAFGFESAMEWFRKYLNN